MSGDGELIIPSDQEDVREALEDALLEDKIIHGDFGKAVPRGILGGALLIDKRLPWNQRDEFHVSLQARVRHVLEHMRRVKTLGDWFVQGLREFREYERACLAVGHHVAPAAGMRFFPGHPMRCGRCSAPLPIELWPAELSPPKPAGRGLKVQLRRIPPDDEPDPQQDLTPRELA